VIATTPATIAYTNPGSEHPDNERFISQCEEWFGQEVIRLGSARFTDTWDVWEKRRFIASPLGAPCTAELKKRVRQDFQRHDDLQVFGYTVEEKFRAERFREQNPEVNLITPLIDAGLTKSDCLAMIDRAGIPLPAMYALGYQNNNCIGCPKGGIGYWNKIRIDFPDTFLRMSLLERDIDASVLRANGESLFLDELDPDRGNHADEPSFECSLLCSVAEEHMEGEKIAKPAIKTTIERFEERVDKSGDCWLWTGFVNTDGYGQFGASGKKVYAHQFSYELYIGKIPEGKKLIHSCRIMNCVRPKHLEAVIWKKTTRRGETGKASGAQMLAKTHCPQDHPYNEENTYRYPNGRRECRICRAEHQRFHRAARRAMIIESADINGMA